MNRRAWMMCVFTGAMMLTLWCCASIASAEERFPPPDFTSHQLPSPGNPNPVGAVWSYVDVAVLIAALSIASWIVLKRRSRNMMFAMTVFSVAYFGFYREGCVCPIGAIQNVSMALADASYAIPITILLFFLAPLVFTLLFGRAFCAGVCPLGAIQDLVLIRPIKVPGAVEQALGLLPYLYLGAAVALAASGSAFIICEYDPFVGFFRFSAELSMIIFGGSLLVIGMFIGRPYCRFLCPYGVILRQLSRVSSQHMNIAPGKCIQCRLCESTCPFGAIDEPVETPARPTAGSRRRAVALVVMLPVIVGGAALLGAGLGFGLGGTLVGGFVGLAIGGRLIRLAMPRPHDEYNANRAACYSCLRCVPACPKQPALEDDDAVVPLPVYPSTEAKS